MTPDEPARPAEPAPPGDGPAVGAGVLAGVPIVAVAAIAQYLTPRGSALAWLLLGVILAGLGIAGGVTARRASRTPITSGGVAGLATFAVVQAVNVVVRVLSAEPVSWIGLAFLSLLSTSCGMLGAWIALRRMDERP